MADNDKIVIDQINWGTNLPEWATEATQLKIAEKLGALKKDADKSSKEDTKQTGIFKKIDERLEKLNNNSSENSKKLITALNKKGGDYAKDLVKKNLDTPFKSVNDVVQGVAKKFGIVSAVLGALASGVGFVIGRLKMFADQFRQVFSMGFRFEQGSMGLARSALMAEMSIASYTEILGKYSTTIGVLGTDAFSNLNVAMRDNLKAQGLLGMSLNELTEFTASYAEALLNAGILQEGNSEYLEEMATNYLRNITAFSTLANVSRDQIDATVKASTSIEAFANKLGMMAPIAQRNVLQAAQTVSAMFAGLGTEFGDQLATTFTTAYGRGGLFFTEAGRSLLAVNRNLYNSLSGIINNLEGMNDFDAAKASAEMFEQMENMSDADRARLGMIERSNTEYAQAARDQIALIRRIEQLREQGALDEFKDLQAMREARKQNLDANTIAFVNFERTVERFKRVFDTFFIKLFGNDRLFRKIGEILNFLQSNADKFVNFLLEGADRLADYFVNLTEAKGIGDFIVRALGPIISALGRAITDAIVNGWNIIRMDLPGFMGGTSPDKKFADTFFDPYDSIRRQSNVNQTNFQNQLDQAQMTRGYLQRMLDDEMAKGYRPEDQGMMGKLFKGDAFYRDDEKVEKFNTRIAELTTTIENLEKSIANSDEERDKAMALLMEDNRREFEKLFGNYDYDASMKAGELVRKAGTDGTGSGTDPASPVDVTDPSLLSQAKMRIMKQYLPMSGSSDPTQDAEGRYYEQMIHSLQQIAVNTQKGADASEAASRGINGT